MQDQPQDKQENLLHFTLTKEFTILYIMPLIILTLFLFEVRKFYDLLVQVLC
jgi:hypothetical protein